MILETVSLDPAGMLQTLHLQHSDNSLDRLIRQTTSLALLESAAQLSSLAASEVRLQLNDMHASDIDLMQSQLHGLGENLLSIQQGVQGFSQGFISWVMSDQSALLLTRKLLNEPSRFSEMTEMEQEAFTEITNISLNSCLAHFTQAFDCRFFSQLPRFQYQRPGPLWDELKCIRNSAALWMGQVAISTGREDYPALLLVSGIFGDMFPTRATGHRQVDF